MNLKTIVVEPNTVLHTIASDVPAADITSKEIQGLITDMKATLRNAPDGVGLAAPQIGISQNIFLVSEEADYIDRESREKSIASRKKNVENREQGTGSREKKMWEHNVFINAALIRSSRKKDSMIEGCLSIPGKFGAVLRSEKVEFMWQDEHGKKHTRGFTGFFARVIQHEYDHIQGFLIADRVKKLVPLDELRTSGQKKT